MSTDGGGAAPYSKMSQMNSIELIFNIDCAHRIVEAVDFPMAQACPPTASSRFHPTATWDVKYDLSR
jgi:hypothetical protein